MIKDENAQDRANDGKEAGAMGHESRDAPKENTSRHSFHNERPGHDGKDRLSKIIQLKEDVIKWEQSGKNGPHPAQKLFEERGGSQK